MRTFYATDYPGGFVVTGRDTRGRRFSQRYGSSTSGAMMALSVNIWNGTVWGIDASGKRRAIKRVSN